MLRKLTQEKMRESVCRVITACYGTHNIISQQGDITGRRKERRREEYKTMRDDTAAAAAAPDDDVDDDRPLLSELLAKHSDQLDEMSEVLQKDPNYNNAVASLSSSSSSQHNNHYQPKYDKVWMLRFVLSHKTVKKAIKAALETIQFRQKHQLDELGDIRHRIFDHCDHLSEHNFDIHRTYINLCNNDDGHQAVMHTLPDVNRGVISYITPQYIYQTKVVKEMTKDELLQVYMLANEMIFQIMDEITRRTNRFTKLLRIMDVTSMPLKNFSRAYMKLDAAANKEMEDYYPQLLGSLLVVNPPHWAHTVWTMLKPLFPKRMVEKLNMIECYPTNNNNNKHQLPPHIQYFTKYISITNLAERYGGTNTEWPPFSACRQFQK